MARRLRGGEQPPKCSLWGSTDFKSFFKKRIRDLEALRANLSHASFIAIDTEHGEGVSSIGLAYAPNIVPAQCRKRLHPANMAGPSKPQALTTEQPGVEPPKRVAAQSVCFNIRGFQRLRPTREMIRGQPDQNVDVKDVAYKVVEAVHNFHEAEPEKPLMLVTYSSGAEWDAIASLCPEFWRLFSTWVDLQPLVADAYHSHTNYTRLNGVCISLRHAMRTLGFTTGYQPSDRHHAGNDAQRTLATLACLVHENVRFRRLKKLEHILSVSQDVKEQNRLKGTERKYGLLRKRPGPHSKYPHVAKVSMRPAPESRGGLPVGQSLKAAVEEGEYEDQLPLPLVDECMDDTDFVWDFFSPYEPAAIGGERREDCYYVCVRSAVALRHLIEDLNDTLGPPGPWTIVAEDVSDFLTLGAAKREEREKRRQEELDWKEILDCIGEMNALSPWLDELDCIGEP